MKSYFVLIFVAVFMPVAMLAYSIVPKRLRGYVLLVFSYAFLMIMSGRPVVYLVAATLITYVTGLAMGHFQARRDARLSEVKKGKKAIKEACKRMGDIEHYGNYTIEAISESVGFKSRSTFVTSFKRITGLTPSQYQRLARKGGQ